MPQNLLDLESQPKFYYALPTPPVIDATDPNPEIDHSYTIQANQVDNFFMGLEAPSSDPNNHEQLTTTVYSYQRVDSSGNVMPGFSNSFYGPTFVAREGVSIDVTWVNNLPPIDPTLLPIDNSIHKADVTPTNAIPIVTHLHGGHTQAASDGHPDAWYTQKPASETPVYKYDNTQQAATLIYHDHALGYTPQNVYAGLAGLYLIRDDNLNKLFAKSVLPSGSNEIGMAVQDHSFTDTGKLYMPGRALDDPIPGQFNADGTQMTVADMLPVGYNGPLPTALPEFFGDVIDVNGMAWPKLDVAKGEYLLHYANASDSRFYVLQMSDPNVKVTLVGNDGGLLKKAMVISDGIDANNDGKPDTGETIILAPGDRIDLVVDFTNAKGDANGDVILQNIGPAFEPFKGLGTFAAGVVNADPITDPVGSVMAFSLNNNLTAFHSKLFDNPADLEPNVVLNPGFHALKEKDATNTRKVGLYESTDQYGRILPLLGTAENTIDINGNPVKAGAMLWDMPTTETPMLGSTEVWDIFNYTADAHPIHLHQVQYQVLGKYMMSQNDINGPDKVPDGVVDQLDYTTAADLNHDGLVNDFRINDINSNIPLRPEDTGWQDTVWVGPGEVLKIIEKFDLPGDYVWHCHILSHENNEMMRRMYVINTVDGTNKGDNLSGTDDIDSITAGKGNDVVVAGLGDDRFIATKFDGNDRYDGGKGIDTLDLSQTTSTAIVNLGSASDWSECGFSGLSALQSTARGMAGGRGFTADGFAAGSQIGFDKLASIENVIGSSEGDYIVGNSSSNLLAGGEGNDWLSGRGGDDRIWGQSGNDFMRGGDGADTFLFYKDFATNKVDTGRDTIFDFNAAFDFLEIDKNMVNDVTNFATAAEFITKHAKETIGGDVTITFDSHNSVTLNNTTLSGLQAHQDHFHFA